MLFGNLFDDLKAGSVQQLVSFCCLTIKFYHRSLTVFHMYLQYLRLESHFQEEKRNRSSGIFATFDTIVQKIKKDA